jgi:hypothetical protein
VTAGVFEGTRTCSEGPAAVSAVPRVAFFGCPLSIIELVELREGSGTLGKWGQNGNAAAVVVSAELGTPNDRPCRDRK